MLNILLFDIVVGSKWLFQVRSNNHSRSLCGCSSDKQHYTTSIVLVSCFQETDSDAHGDASATLGSLICGHWPGVTLKLLQNRRQGVLALLDGQQEARVATWRKGCWLSWSNRLLRSHRLCSKSEHFLNLFAGVILVAAEHVRLWALAVSQLVHLSLIVKE